MQELLKRLQDRHVECAQAVAKKAAADAASAAAVTPDAQNVLQAMMQLEQAKTRAKAANKIALHAEKEKDAAEQEVQMLQQLLQAKRARTHATTTNSQESVRRSHRTTGTSLIIVVRLHAFKTAAQLLSALAQKFQLRRKARRTAGAFSPGACGMD